MTNVQVIESSANFNDPMVICDLLRIAVRFITLLPLAIGGMLTKTLRVI